MKFGIGMGLPYFRITNENNIEYYTSLFINEVTKYRLLSNGLVVKRNNAKYYIASNFMLNGDEHSSIFSINYPKNLAINIPLFSLLFYLKASNVLDSSQFTNISAGGSDDNAPINVNGSNMGGNHSYDKTSALKIVYSGDFATHSGNVDNSTIVVDPYYTNSINSKLFDLIGKDNLSLTVDGSDIPILVIGVFPALWNYKIDNARLSNVQILFYSGHNSSSLKNWLYTKLSSGVISGIKCGTTSIDLSLLHATASAIKTVLAYSWGTINQSILDLYNGFGYLTWITNNAISTRVLSITGKDSLNSDVFSNVVNNTAASSTYSATSSYIDITGTYQLHNIYNLILNIKLNRPYTFDQDKFVSDNRNSGYYGNPIYNEINTPLALIVLNFRFRDYCSIDIKRQIKFYTLLDPAYACYTWPVQTTLPYSYALPAEDTGKLFSIYYYIPNYKGQDKIQLYNLGSSITGSSANCYSSKVLNRVVYLTANASIDSNTRVNRLVFYCSSFRNPVLYLSCDASRSANVNTQVLLSPVKTACYTIDKFNVMNLYAKNQSIITLHATRQQLPSGNASNISNHATAVYWCLSDNGRKAYLNIDFHRDVLNQPIKLPINFAKRRFTIYDTNNGVQISGSSNIITASISTTVNNCINSDGTLYITTDKTGDTAYSNSKASNTIYNLTATSTGSDGRLPITSIPNGNLAYFVLLVDDVIPQNISLAPSIPVSNNAISTSVTYFTASWNTSSNADSYRLQVATDINFSNVLSLYNNVTISSISSVTCPVSNLTAVTDYYYRVKASNAYGDSQYSNTINVTTSDDFIAPSNLSIYNIKDTSFTASWSASFGADSYTILIDTSSLFSSPTTQSNIKDTVSGISSLSYGTTYYCRVKGVKGLISSPYSNTASQVTAYKIPIKSLGNSNQSFILRTSANTIMNIDNGYFYNSDYSGSPVQQKTIVGGTTDRIFYLKYPAANAVANIYIQNGDALLTKINWPAGATEANGTYPSAVWNYALPKNLLHFQITTYVRWTYSGSMPSSLTYLTLDSAYAAWTYGGAMPTGLTGLYLGGGNINWTGTNVSGSGTVTQFTLNNYRTTAMNITSLIELLTSASSRTFSVATITIKLYDETGTNPTAAQIRDASPNVSGTNALKARYWINQILAGAVNTVVINTTSIT